MTAKSAAVYPEACILLFTLHHPFFSHFHSCSQTISSLTPGSDLFPGLLCTLVFPPLPLGSVCKCEDEIEGTNYETQECIPYLV